MTRLVYAPYAAPLVIALALSVGLLGGSPLRADEPPHVPNLDTQPTDFYKLVKHFDFDEQPLGNYEETPMHWMRLAGPGLPTYARGRFDHEVGHEAPPSFQLRLIGGNVGYEYRQRDLTVIPGSDYRVDAYVRTEGLRQARAFLEVYLVDRYGETIPRSNRVSELIRSDPSEATAWQLLWVDVPGDYPTAYALRPRLWILQSYVWCSPSELDVDPIVRRDIHARAWFDDISVYRLPKARLRLSNPGGIVAAGQAESFLLEFASATAQGLDAEFVITDSADRVCHTERADVPSALNRSGAVVEAETGGRHVAGQFPETQSAPSPAPATVSLRIPALTPGLYRASLRILAGNHLLMERTMRFAVLAELPLGARRRADLGVDIGPWRAGDTAGAHELAAALGCGAVKIGVPMVTSRTSNRETENFRQIGDLVRQLARQRIETTGVILAPAAARGTPTHEFIETNSNWRRLSSPTLAYFSGLLRAWQLGYEDTELRHRRGWDPALVEQVREHAARFIAIPELIVPHDALNPPPPDGDPQTIWVPAAIPARTLPRQLEFLVQPGTAARWLTLESDQRPGLERESRLADLARRIVLAKALGPECVFVQAPFELTNSSGGLAWQPTEEYLVLRTLFHALSGKDAIGAMTLENDGVALVFDDTISSCLVAWTWRDEPAGTPVELYLGQTPSAVDLWGRPQPTEITDGRTRLRLTPMPLIVHGVDAPLALLQASFRIDPTHVQLHDPEPRPVLSFRNFYEQQISGSITLEPPKWWELAARSIRFELGPGETFERVLKLVLPPRQVAAQHGLRVRISVKLPASAELEFVVPITVGLRDILLEAQAWWRDDDLVVQQLLRNLSDKSVSFTAFCQAPAWARAEQTFLNLAPGDVAVRVYRFTDARELTGSALHLGIQEIRGERALDQLVEVPR